MVKKGQSTEYELATAHAKLYPSTHKKLLEIAKEHRTSIANIVQLLLDKVGVEKVIRYK